MPVASECVNENCQSLHLQRPGPDLHQSRRYKLFKALAPTREILQIEDQSEYRRRYRAEVLDRLDPHTLEAELLRLTGGAEPVLQCFEKPPFDARNWCHRRMVAEWFEERTGQRVDELTPETMDERRKHADDRLRAKAAPSMGFDLRSSLIPLRPMVEAIRREIDRFWERVCHTLGIDRDCTGIGVDSRRLDCQVGRSQ
ncbi:MAG: DUF488 family protein [Verrucomicrobiota bacterium]